MENKKEHKLGIIVPYRDRNEHLEIFKKEIKTFFKTTDISYELIIVEQGDEKPFNRGKLLNIGYTFAKKLKCDYIVFHDVDMIPIDVDYSYSTTPIHLATNFISEDPKINKKIFDEYFGGVTIFPIEIFKKINGFSNRYWGWGFEDDELLLRCKNNSVALKEKRIYNLGKTKNMIHLNGYNSHIEINETLNLNEDITIFLSFYPKDCIFDYKKEVDDFPIFSIPGYDFTISYNSFSRYSLIIFDKNKKPIHIYSDIKRNYKTNITVTINSTKKEITMYQDGILVGSESGYGELYDYSRSKAFFIGSNNPYLKEKEKINYFFGYFDSIAIFSKCLNSNDIYDFSNNEFIKFNKTEFAEDLILYYDTNKIDKYKLTDLTGRKNNAIIFNSNIDKVKIDDYVELKIPFRRESLFKLLFHKENGFMNNKWKETTTRTNQLRFYNINSKNITSSFNDGLNSLKFRLLKEENNNNIKQIKVKL